MTDKIYPAIYEAVDGNIYIYLDAENYYSHERECWDVSNGGDSHSTDKNITHEYLSNTYGEVVSHEHAEFIIELAKSNSIEISSEYKGGAMWFNFKHGILDFYESKEIASNAGEKQITIPLPPKQIQTATPEEEFEMTQIMKNAGDNLVLGCEDSKCEEWPCVGDYAISNDGSKVTVRCIVRDLAWCERAESSMQMITMHICNLRKPKTPEEELRDEIKQEVFSSFIIMPELLAKRDVVIGISESVANNIVEYITKKPQ